MLVVGVPPKLQGRKIYWGIATHMVGIGKIVFDWEKKQHLLFKGDTQYMKMKTIQEVAKEEINVIDVRSEIAEEIAKFIEDNESDGILANLIRKKFCKPKMIEVEIHVWKNIKDNDIVVYDHFNEDISSSNSNWKYIGKQKIEFLDNTFCL